MINISLVDEYSDHAWYAVNVALRARSIRGGTSRLDPPIHLGSRVDAVDNKRPAHGMWLAWRGHHGHLGQSGHQLGLEAGNRSSQMTHSDIPLK